MARRGRKRLWRCRTTGSAGTNNAFLKPRQVLGVDALRGFFRHAGPPAAGAAGPAAARAPGFDNWSMRLVAGGRGLIMTMGKARRRQNHAGRA